MAQTASFVSFPEDKPNQVYVQVSAIHGGQLCLSERDCFEGATKQEFDIPRPSLAFLLKRQVSGTDDYTLFDFGLRKDNIGYPPAMQPDVEGMKLQCPIDVKETLELKGIALEQIGRIAHLHFDHVGNPSQYPKETKIILGPGGKRDAAEGWPKDPESEFTVIPYPERIEELDLATSGTPFGPFKKAIDYFGDGSLYFCGLPGHTAGHMSAVARIGPNAFAALGGDTCHHCLVFQGKRGMSPEMHQDMEQAQDSLRQLQAMDKAPGAKVLLAHDFSLLEAGMPTLPATVNEWVTSEIAKRG